MDKKIKASTDPHRLKSANDEAFEIGRVVSDKYKVISVLGMGGMGTVYRVHHIFLNKDFALKTMSSRSVTDVSVQRFHKEAKAASLLNHPNLVHVSDFGVLDDGTPYLVMDFIDGITFAQYLKENGPLPTGLAATFFSPVCFGLLAAHGQGVIHRDIKPGNIMVVKTMPLGSDGSIKVVDFGVAKHRESGEIQELTRTGEIFGSPLYMSPEQCTGGVVDHRSDIYSMGCVLFEMLTGTPPFMGQNALATMMLHETGQAPSLKEASLGKEYPLVLEQIVSKMLRKSPVDRYENIGLVAHDLAAARQDNGMKITAPEITLRKNPSEKVQSKSSGSLITLLLSTAVLCATVAGVIGYNLGQHDTLIKSSKISNSAGSTSSSKTETNSTHLGAHETKSPDEAEKDNSIRNSPDIVGDLDKSKNTRTYVFPKRPIGELLVYTIETPSARGAKLAVAQDRVTIPADKDLTLNVEGPDFILDAHNPFILNKIRGKEFRGIMISSSIMNLRKIIDDSEDADPVLEEESSLAIGILQNLTGWTNLDSLSIKNFRLSSDAYPILDQLKKLQRLSLDQCKFDVESLAKLKAMRRLHYFALNSIEKNGDQILKAMSGSSEIENLRLTSDQNQITSVGVEALAKCPNLTELAISFEGAKIDEALLSAICHLPRLHNLFLTETVLSDKQLQMLSQCSSHAQVILSQNRYSPQAKEHIKSILQKVRFI